MNIDDIFFQVTSQLTGGVITDFGTAIAGLVFLLAVLAGFDLLKDLFEASMMNRTASRNFDAARNYAGLRDMSDRGSVEYDYYNALYRSHLNKSARLGAKTGKTYYDEGAGFSDIGIVDDPYEDRR